MARYNYLLLCENFLSNDGKASIVNIFDVVGAETFPTIPTKFTIAISIAVMPEDIRNDCVKTRVEIRDPNNKKVLEASAEVPISADAAPANIVSNIDLSGQIAFKSEGTYRIILSANGKKLTECPFKIVKTSDQEGKK